MGVLRVTGRVRLHDPEQVESAVAEAVRIANVNGLDGADRAALLPQILQFVLQEHVAIEQTQFGAGQLAVPHGL